MQHSKEAHTSEPVSAPSLLAVCRRYRYTEHGGQHSFWRHESRGDTSAPPHRYM